MSLEAIAAMLGHRSMDITLRYTKIANRTIADDYFAVTDQVDALYPSPKRSRRRDRTEDGPPPPPAPPTAGQRLLPPPTGSTAPSINMRDPSFFQTSIAFRPTLQAQHDDAETKGKLRADLYDKLLAGLKEGAAS